MRAHCREHTRISASGFATLDKTAVQAVVTAQVEGCVTNSRMQEITGEHSKDITGVLQRLVRNGLLTQQNQRRWASYRVVKDSPQSPTNPLGTPLIWQRAPLICPRSSCHWLNQLDSKANCRQLKCKPWFCACAMAGGRTLKELQEADANS